MLLSNRIAIWLKSVLLETARISADLFKLMIPILLLVKLIETFGGIELLARLLEPMMSGLGLPPEMGIVWAGAMLSNIYTGMVLFVSEPVSASLTVAQVTIVGMLMLFAHSLPVELRVTQKIGIPVWFSLLLRVLAAYASAWLYVQLIAVIGDDGGPVQILWQPEVQQQDLLSWLMSTLYMLMQIVVIIALLVVLLRVIRALRLDRLIHLLLSPLLPLLGLSGKAVNIVLVGITLGLTYGGGLLIQESKQGTLPVRELFYSVCLLLICHSLIEDTLLILLLGADVYGVLLLRIVLSLILVAALVRVTKHIPASVFERYLLRP